MHWDSHQGRSSGFSFTFTDREISDDPWLDDRHSEEEPAVSEVMGALPNNDSQTIATPDTDPASYASETASKGAKRMLLLLKSRSMAARRMVAWKTSSSAEVGLRVMCPSEAPTPRNVIMYLNYHYVCKLPAQVLL